MISFLCSFPLVASLCLGFQSVLTFNEQLQLQEIQKSIVSTRTVQLQKQKTCAFGASMEIRASTFVEYLPPLKSRVAQMDGSSKCLSKHLANGSLDRLNNNISFIGRHAQRRGKPEYVSLRHGSANDTLFQKRRRN